MNTLIIGGLLGLALVAILGAILLGISEDRAEKTQKASKGGSAPAETVAPATALLPQQSQSRQLAYQAPDDQMVAPLPVTVRQTGQLPALSDEDTLTSLNGQAYQIASELRALAQRAGELEQRLRVISEALEDQQAHPAEIAGQFYTPRTDSTASL